VKVGKVFDGATMPTPRHGENHYTLGLEQSPQVIEGDGDRRGHMLENVRRDNEIQRSFHVWGRRENVQPRFRMIIRIDVVELFRQRRSIALPIRHADASDVGPVREIHQRQAFAEKLDG
jgi:hypothetical protein